MTQKLPLDILIELANERTDQAARRLAAMLQAQAGAQERLALLLQYREEYLAQFQERMRQGVPSSQLRNFQRFVVTLDSAVEQQRQLARQADARLAEGRSDWQACKRRLGAFDTLAARARQHEAVAESRQAQREGDQRTAARLHLRASAFAG